MIASIAPVRLDDYGDGWIVWGSPWWQPMRIVSLPPLEPATLPAPRPKGKTTRHGRLVGIRWHNNSESQVGRGWHPEYVFRPASRKPPKVRPCRRPSAGRTMPRVAGRITERR